VVKTVILRKTIRVFEIVQTVIAFGLAATALLTFAPSLGSSLLGVICLALSAAAYLLVFRFFAHQSARRNYMVFAAWSAALFLLGCILAVPSPLSAPLLALVALAATWIGIRANRVAIQFQATAYLIAAAIVSGMPAYVFYALAGVMPSAPSWPVVVVSICAAACYLVRKPLPRESWQSQLMQLVAATFSVSVVAAFLVNLLARLAAFAIQPQAHHLALIRTFVLCATVLSLAFAGVRGRRPELSRIAYFALALVAVKLVLEDLSHGQLAFIAASIFLFAVTLMVVPRLARAGKRLQSQLE
jgi:MFS family permease